MIDVIDDNSFQYHYGPGLAVGGFDWNLEVANLMKQFEEQNLNVLFEQFNWHGIPDHEKKRRPHSSDPVYSPTMAGGLFAIDKAFFEKLGTYDDGFDIWGGENLELSFKVIPREEQTIWATGCLRSFYSAKRINNFSTQQFELRFVHCL